MSFFLLCFIPSKLIVICRLFNTHLSLPILALCWLLNVQLNLKAFSFSEIMLTQVFPLLNEECQSFKVIKMHHLFFKQHLQSSGKYSSACGRYSEMFLLIFIFNFCHWTVPSKEYVLKLYFCWAKFFPWGDSHKKGQGCLLYLLGVKKVVLVPLGVFSLKRSTAGAFTLHFRVLSWKKSVSVNVLP